MRNCEQTKGLSVLEHGESVKNYLFDILDHLQYGTKLRYEWRLPDWVISNKDLILSDLPSRETLSLYTTYHDIGKPFCREVDSEGKVHFPNHSEVSYKIFKKHFDDDIAAELIRRDMDIHLLKSDGVESFAQSDYALTLLLTGLAEIHSNASMFGGTDSVSFLIKKKQIFKRGKSIINIIKNKTEI